VATLRCKDGFQKTIRYGVEQYTNARGLSLTMCRARGNNGLGRVFLGKLSPFTTTSSNVDLGCIFEALFCGHGVFLLFPLIDHHHNSSSRDPRELREFSATKDSSQRTNHGFVVCGPFWYTTSLVGQNAVNVWKNQSRHIL
jgi:hypothetical protein